MRRHRLVPTWQKKCLECLRRFFFRREIRRSDCTQYFLAEICGVGSCGCMAAAQRTSDEPA